MAAKRCQTAFQAHIVAVEAFRAIRSALRGNSAVSLKVRVRRGAYSRARTTRLCAKIMLPTLEANVL